MYVASVLGDLRSARKARICAECLGQPADVNHVAYLAESNDSSITTDFIAARATSERSPTASERVRAALPVNPHLTIEIAELCGCSASTVGVVVVKKLRRETFEAR